mmetsp:Transcript_27244/g.51435  ORF Transcript_27244/g.51435 Transcript_27244/m.51435 type:complete len:119 (+) Transcript_27244:3-359(+)
MRKPHLMRLAGHRQTEAHYGYEPSLPPGVPAPGAGGPPGVSAVGAAAGASADPADPPASGPKAVGIAKGVGGIENIALPVPPVSSVLPRGVEGAAAGDAAPAAASCAACCCAAAALKA